MTTGDNPTGLLKCHQVAILRNRPGTRIRRKVWKQLLRQKMHVYRTILAGKDGSGYEIFSVPSRRRNVVQTLLFVVEYAPGQYRYARHGVESILKSFRRTEH